MRRGGSGVGVKSGEVARVGEKTLGGSCVDGVYRLGAFLGGGGEDK